ncbi:MAG: hypothetical protein F4X98_15715 [Gammaproteobacteria bacterium]|nr:hypothetical protein [Gammaproteobacteria bacterium]
MGDRFSSFQTATITQDPDSTTESALLECLTPESNADFAISMFSATAGGLSAETRNCLTDAFTQNLQAAISFATSGPPSDDAPPAAFEALSCLSPDEAAAMTPEGDSPPDTAALRCLTEELTKVEDGQEILRIFSPATRLGSPSNRARCQAMSNCGIETDFTFPDPSTTSSEGGSASTDEGTDNTLQLAESLLLYMVGEPPASPKFELEDVYRKQVGDASAGLADVPQGEPAR